MSLAKSIENGIRSATYNPQAEKAIQEEKIKATEAKQKYRNTLFKLRDTKSQLVQQKKASDYYIQTVDKLANDGFAWIQANPDADSQQINNKILSTDQQYQDIARANTVVMGISVLPKFFRTVAADAFLKKQIKNDKKNLLNNYADSLEKWMKLSPSLTSDAIFSKQQEIEQKSRSLLEGTGQSIPALSSESSVVAAKKQTDAMQVKVTQEEEADKNTFKVSRLLSETGRIAMKVVGSLFIVMLILVSGMLTANDAIARDPQYRILYFIYGGLGFPIMLVYYLYRWFSGTAPHIYRLLPLYTEQADTTLGRFFLFPFTYEEDKAAKDAKTGFLTAAASLVGKQYTAPAEKAATQLGSIVEGIQSVSLNASQVAVKTVEKAVKGTNTILKGIQQLNVSK
jgi:hypothetical protein